MPSGSTHAGRRTLTDSEINALLFGSDADVAADLITFSKALGLDWKDVWGEFAAWVSCDPLSVSSGGAWAKDFYNNYYRWPWDEPVAHTVRTRF